MSLDPDIVLQHMITLYGLLTTVINERNPILTSHSGRKLLGLCGIRSNRSIAFHPQSDGAAKSMCEAMLTHS